MKKNTPIVLIVLLVVGISIILFFVFNKEASTDTSSYVNTTENLNTNSTLMNNTTNTAEEQQAKLSEKPVITMQTSLGTVTIKLYTAEAPELTKNFIELAKDGFYDGLTFHRVVPGFVIQGGDPLGTGTGGHSYKGEGIGLADEAGALALKHEKGALAWAKSSLPNSIGSQFYIALDRLTQLDGSYSVFGQVVDGMDVVEKIGSVQTDPSSKPTTPVTITSVTIGE